MKVDARPSSARLPPTESLREVVKADPKRAPPPLDALQTSQSGVEALVKVYAQAHQALAASAARFELGNVAAVTTPEVSVAPYESLDVSKLGKMVGTAPGAAVQHRWSIPVASLPLHLQKEIAQNPFLRGADAVQVDLPQGQHGISAIGFMNSVQGGHPSEGLRGFMSRGIDVVSDSERRWLVGELNKVSPALAGRVARGESLYDLMNLQRRSVPTYVGRE